VDLCGFEPPEDFQGMSLRPLLGHPDRLGKKKYAYTVVRRGQNLGYAIRSQRWRYSQWPQGEELYNLTNDPEEQRNLAGKSHVEARLVEMRQILDEKRKVAGAIRTIE
ncbi:MAG: sulfatase/phosphatase domain-containing protein, partial [Planctomycetota bacterium]|nr:sulfatase/phosphatase domain-containing protein [Planctomycetota bacterium]